MKKLIPILALLCYLISVKAYGQTTGALLPNIPPDFRSAAGIAASGAKLCAFAAGTTTPLAIYSDSALSTTLPNPNTLDSVGRPTNSGGTAQAIYIQPRNYKFILYPATATGAACPLVGTPIWSRDNVYDAALLPAFNNTQFCARQPGSTAGVKIAAAIAALPSTGGRIDCTDLQGLQSIPTTVTVDRPVELLICGATFSSAATTMFTVASAMTVQGCGPTTSVFQQTFTNTTAFDVITTKPFRIDNVAISSSNLGQVSGAGIKLNGTGGANENNQSRISNVQMLYQYVGIDSSQAIGWNAYNNNFNGVVHDGIRINNTYSADGGDIAIYGNIFNPATIGGGSAAIELIAGSSLRIQGNKFFLHKDDLLVNLNTAGGASAGSVQLSFTNNISEPKEVGGAVLRFARTSGSFLNMTVSGNQYQSDATHYGNFLKFESGTTQWALVCSITGNLHYMTTNGTSMEFAGNGNGDLCDISGNTIMDTTGGAASVGISIGAGYNRMHVGNNYLYGTTTPTSIVAGSTRGSFLPDRLQIGGNPNTQGTTEPLMLQNNASIVGRDSTNSNWNPLLIMGSTNLIYVGTTNGRSVSIPMALTVGGSISTTDCAVAANGANIALCQSYISGSTTIAAGQTSVQINTTAITANARIFVSFDSTLGTKLGVTCNANFQQPFINTRSAGSALVISVAAMPAANPLCLNWFLVQ